VADISIRSQLLFFDIERINQVLNNLIGNAIKYSFPDTIITIKVFIKNNLITTQIIDQGQGISTNELASIFLPFKRTSTKPTAGENSHGLGLAIVKRIIEGHNGTVKVTSELNKGSVFQFTLPLL